jgi:hypothetical protein
MGTILHTFATLNATRVQFLLLELESGMTFLDVADVTSSCETAARNNEHARVAYETVLRLQSTVRPTPEDRAVIADKLDALKRRLQAVGCKLSSNACDFEHEKE